MKISKEYSKKVFDDAIKSVKNPMHPCHHFFRWQSENGYIPYQLPEPFSGDQAKLGIAFIGLNPSITRDQIIPCMDSELSFKKYDSYYRNRFSNKNRDNNGKLIIRRKDGTTVKPRFWNNIETFANNHLHVLVDSKFKLGEHAIISQAIRFKSKEGWYGDNRFEKERTIEHQKQFIEELINNEGINIFVPTGNDALKIITSIINFNEAVPTKITHAMGNKYTGITKSNKLIIICPIQHLSRPPSYDIQKKVANKIIESFNQLNKNKNNHTYNFQHSTGYQLKVQYPPKKSIHSNYSETKPCPFCGSPIRKLSTYCENCKHNIPPDCYIDKLIREEKEKSIKLAKEAIIKSNEVCYRCLYYKVSNIGPRCTKYSSNKNRVSPLHTCDKWENRSSKKT